MAVDHVTFGGWKNNLRLSNDHAELIVTLDVGPRVISYRTTGGENVFKIFDEQLGGIGEAKWKARGGHRFWLAPEDETLSYIPDNSPVEHQIVSPNEVKLTSAPGPQLQITKELTLALEPDSSRVTVTHRATNHGKTELTLATWGLSVMRPGGIEIIPLPPPGEHPRDLLPNRTLVLWSYTDMADSRWRWGKRFITLQQADSPPTKLGIEHREDWIGYHRGDSLFLKSIEFRENTIYPDGGCNFETFTNEEMLEVEALGPLVTLTRGAAATHTERWHLLANVDPPPRADEEISAWIAPLLSRAAIDAQRISQKA